MMNRVAIIACVLLLFVIAWVRQYLKFRDGHGLFFLVSQEHGVAILTLSLALLFSGSFLFAWLWERKKNKKVNGAANKNQESEHSR